MLLEQVKRQYCIYFLSSESLGKSSSLATWLLGISKTTMGVGVSFEVEDSLVLVRFTREESWNDSLNLKERRISDASL
jgi:hypothetical protein